MKWLVTGGCGFIGANLADALLRDGESVTLFDNLYREGSEQNLAWIASRHPDAFRFIRGDVRDADAVLRIIQDDRPEAIAHLAGQVAMTTSLADPRFDFEVNAGGTLNLLEAVRKECPDSPIVFSSSNKVYGALDQLHTEEQPMRYVLPDYPLGLDESLPLEGHSPYGCSKLAADQYVHDYARVFGLRTVVFRHSSMYGGRQYATFDQGWIGWFCQKALEAGRAEGRTFTINGNGKQVRDVLFAEDAIAAYRGAVAHIEVAAGKVYNIGGGMDNSLSLLELFAMLEKLAGCVMAPTPLEWRQGDQKVFVADIRRAARDLQWRPTVSSEDGVRETLKWTREALGDA
jgi:CDP-paratose 2-epimerase